MGRRLADHSERPLRERERERERGRLKRRGDDRKMGQRGRKTRKTTGLESEIINSGSVVRGQRKQRQKRSPTVSEMLG